MNNFQVYVEIDGCWISQVGNDFFIGLNSEVVAELGNVTFVDRIPIGKVLSKGSVVGIIETSNKGDWHFKSPIDAQVIGFNDKLNKTPCLVCNSPTDEGWIVKCKLPQNQTLDSLGEVKSR